MPSITDRKAILQALNAWRIRAPRPSGNLTPQDQSTQIALYAEDLADSGYDPRDVAAAALAWPTEFFPAWALVKAAVEDAASRRKLQEGQQAKAPVGPAASGENFVERALRLGFHAGRLSRIGHGRWHAIAEEHASGRLHDADFAAALRWCEANLGFPWRRTRTAPVDPEAVRESGRLLERIRKHPEAYNGLAPALMKMGEDLMARHIARGEAPKEVAAFYEGKLDVARARLAESGEIA